MHAAVHFEFLWTPHSLRPVGLQVVGVVCLEAALLLRLVFLHAFVLQQLLGLLQRLRPVCRWRVNIDAALRKQLLVYAEHFPACSSFHFSHLIRLFNLVYRFRLAYFVLFRCDLPVLGVFFWHLGCALLFAERHFVVETVAITNVLSLLHEWHWLLVWFQSLLWCFHLIFHVEWRPHLALKRAFLLLFYLMGELGRM